MAIQMIATGGVPALSTMAPTVAAALWVDPELIGYQVSMASFAVALPCFASGLLPLMVA